MNDEKWYNLRSQIEEKFGIEDAETVEDNIIDDTGKTYAGTKDILVFKGQLGKMKLERVNHPLILDKKMHYHKGSGGTADIEYVISDTEMSHRVTGYIWDDALSDWKELDLPSGSMSF